MTRLRIDDIVDIPANLEHYDAELMAKAGCTLRGIACQAAGIDEERVQTLSDSVIVAVVPTTCGKGIISGFADTVKEIVNHVGFKAFVTKGTDVVGLAEAFQEKADIIMLADDDQFVAINVEYRHVVENAEATGKGYVAGLNLMTGGLTGERILVLGCGPVGYSAAMALIKLGAKLSVYDVLQERCQRIADQISRTLNVGVTVEKTLSQALRDYRFLIDATPASEIITGEAITPNTYISAPGIPHGLSQSALKKISGRLIHDPLQLGVATMIVEAACPFLMEESKDSVISC